MSIFEQLVSGLTIPRMAKVRQSFPRPVIEDLPKEISEQFIKNRNVITARIKKGDRVAVTVGSRGLANIQIITREIVKCLKSIGAEPFIIPTMGSHGGATAEGQTEVLQKLGITEESVGAPIRATMEVVQIGTTESGLPVYFDKNAACEAEATVVVGRIKPHTSFRGTYESGIAKMIVIGLGKQKGAELCHATGLDQMSNRIEEIAREAIDKSNIAFGIGLIENPYDETCKIELIPKEKIMEEEPALLLEAKNNLPKILFNKCDVLIVDEIGKNISGLGMDSNIIRRFGSEAMKCDPLAQIITVLDLTEESHGNANGVGVADICTRRLFEKMDIYNTYPNPLTSRVLGSVKIPMIMENDSQAIRAGIKSCFDIDYKDVKIIRIKNTLKLDEIYISENMLDEARENSKVEILEAPRYMEFNPVGNLF